MTLERLNEALPVVIDRLRSTLQPLAIYLHGSFARGCVGPDSDLDLVVVLRESSLSFYERAARAYRALANVGVPVDLQVYTKAEFDDRARLPVSFEHTVQTTGQIVYAA